MPKSKEDKKVEEVLRELDGPQYIDCCHSKDLSVETYYYTSPTDGTRVYCTPCKKHLHMYRSITGHRATGWLQNWKQKV